MTFKSRHCLAGMRRMFVRVHVMIEARAASNNTAKDSATCRFRQPAKPPTPELAMACAAALALPPSRPDVACAAACALSLMSPQSHCCLPGHQPLPVLRCHSAAAHGLQSKLHISVWAIERLPI